MGLRSQSLSQAQAGEGVGSWGGLEKEGGRRGHKVEVVELDLEWVKGDWECYGVGCGRNGLREKKKSLKSVQETLY